MKIKVKTRAYEKYPTLHSWQLSGKFVPGPFYGLSFVVWVVFYFTTVFIYNKPLNYPVGFVNFLFKKKYNVLLQLRKQS